MGTTEFTIERGFAGTIRGEHWRALMRAGGELFGAAGASAWEAIAWCLVEREERRAGIFRMARETHETPITTLANLPAIAKRFGVGYTMVKDEAPAPKSAAARRARSRKK